MFRKTTLALLAGASSLISVPHHAMAIDASAQPEPTVIYANQGAPQPPRRTAYVQPQRSNMGGGFIEFLFGDAPRGGRYEQMYQQQPDVGFDGRRMSPQGMYGQDAAEPAQRSVDPRYNKQMVDYHDRESAGTIVIDTPNSPPVQRASASSSPRTTCEPHTGQVGNLSSSTKRGGSPLRRSSTGATTSGITSTINGATNLTHNGSLNRTVTGSYSINAAAGVNIVAPAGMTVRIVGAEAFATA